MDEEDVWEDACKISCVRPVWHLEEDTVLKVTVEELESICAALGAKGSQVLAIAEKDPGTMEADVRALIEGTADRICACGQNAVNDGSSMPMCEPCYQEMQAHT